MFKLLHLCSGLLLIMTSSSIHSAAINSKAIVRNYELNCITCNYSIHIKKGTNQLGQWNKTDSLELSLPLENENLIIKKRYRRNNPVLEPLRHLLNHVRDSHLNHTIHHNHENHYHHLLKDTSDMNTVRMMMNNKDSNEIESSEAIETEMERESTNESNDLRFLEFLGAIGSKLFRFFTNLRHLFAASSTPVLAASSSSSTN